MKIYVEPSVYDMFALTNNPNDVNCFLSEILETNDDNRDIIGEIKHENEIINFNKDE